MKSSVRVCLGLVATSAALAFVGCGDDDDASPGAAGTPAHGGAEAHGGATGHGGEPHGGAGHGDGALICEVIGELCHEADTGSGPGHDCHQLGHVGNADACVEGFDGCVALCTGEDEGTGGAGGAGPALDAHCAALGELCHGLADAGPVQECHELGHVGNAANCAAEFDNCATLCLAAHEALEEGVGGAGAGGVSSGGATSAGGVAGTPSGGAAQ